MNFEGIHRHLGPVIAKLGFRLIGCDWDDESQALQLYIQGETRVSFRDCAKVTKSLLEDTLLDQLVGRPDYRLEVGSPGPLVPLRSRASFESLEGFEIDGTYVDSLSSDPRTFTGSFEGFGEDGALKFRSKERHWILDYSQILNAYLKPSEPFIK